MINRICDICSEYVTDVWSLKIKDDKDSVEFSGHLACIDRVQDQMNSIKDVHKMTLHQTLKKLNLKS